VPAFRVLVNLPGLNFPLKVIKFFHWQASKEFDAAPYLKGGLKKALKSLLVGIFQDHRIRDAPVGSNRRAGARVIGDRDDEVKMDARKITPRFAEGSRRVDFEVFAENFEHERIEFARWRFAATVYLKTAVGH
jgi:hypothetical protein